MRDIEAFKEIIMKMYDLVKIDGDQSRLNALMRWHNLIEDHFTEITREIIHCSIGQGSWSDFHLYKDGQYLEEENEIFYNLHERLLQLCVDALPEISRSTSPDHPDAS